MFSDPTQQNQKSSTPAKQTLAEAVQSKINEKKQEIISSVYEEGRKNNWDRERAAEEIQKRLISLATSLLSKPHENPTAEAGKTKEASVAPSSETRVSPETQTLTLPPASKSTNQTLQKSADIASNTSVVDTKKETQIQSSKDISFSIKSQKGIFEATQTSTTVNTDGSFSVVKKNLNGTTTDITSNFQVLYLGNDNVLRDPQGAVVNRVKTPAGSVPGSAMSNFLELQGTKSGGIISVKNHILNSFEYSGKQVLFVKGAPPVTSSVVAQTKDSASAETKKESATANAATPIPQEQKIEKTDSASQAKTNEQKSTTKDVQRIPWSEYTYNEQINGCWYQKKAYVRKNTVDGKDIVEIFKGKDTKGNEVWADISTSTKPAFTVVKVDTSSGTFRTQEGKEIKSFSTVNGYPIAADAFKNSLEQKEGLRGLKSSQLNNLLVDGKRPIFL